MFFLLLLLCAGAVMHASDENTNSARTTRSGKVYSQLAKVRKDVADDTEEILVASIALPNIRRSTTTKKRAANAIDYHKVREQMSTRQQKHGRLKVFSPSSSTEAVYAPEPMTATTPGIARKDLFDLDSNESLPMPPSAVEIDVDALIQKGDFSLPALDQLMGEPNTDIADKIHRVNMGRQQFATTIDRLAKNNMLAIARQEDAMQNNAARTYTIPSPIRGDIPTVETQEKRGCKRPADNADDRRTKRIKTETPNARFTQGLLKRYQISPRAARKSSLQTFDFSHYVAPVKKPEVTN